jgi:hypothetical protein
MFLGTEAFNGVGVAAGVDAAGVDDSPPSSQPSSPPASGMTVDVGRAELADFN